MSITKRFLGLKFNTGGAYGFCEQINTGLSRVPYGSISVGGHGSFIGTRYYWTDYDDNSQYTNDISALPGFYLGYRSHAMDSRSGFTAPFSGGYGTQNPAILYKDGKLAPKIDVYIKRRSGDTLDTDSDILNKCEKITIVVANYRYLAVVTSNVSLDCHFLRASHSTPYNTAMVRCVLDSGGIKDITNDFYIDIYSYGAPTIPYGMELTMPNFNTEMLTTISNRYNSIYTTGVAVYQQIQDLKQKYMY